MKKNKTRILSVYLVLIYLTSCSFLIGVNSWQIDTTGSACGVYVSGDYAYVADGDNGLQIINISNPSKPVLEGSCDTPGYAQDVYVSGDYAYVADGDSGLRIIDISNPKSPTEISYYSTSGEANDVFITDNRAYIACVTNGLIIIDISNPSLLIELGHYQEIPYSYPQYIYKVYVSNNYAYITFHYADYQWGTTAIEILDVSNLSSLKIIGFCSTNGDAELYVSGSYAYIADGRGIRIMDISNPTSPTEVSSCDTPRSVKGVYVSGNYIYVADGDSGLRIIDISNPSNPAEVVCCDTPGYANGVFVSGSYAYVADNDNGLRIIKVK